MTIFEKALDDEIRAFYIPKKPNILIQIRHVIDDRESTNADLVAVLLSERYLSSEILEAINSSTFSLDRKIQNIQHAVSLMGKHAINDISTAILFRRSVIELRSCLSLEVFWGDATDVANAMAFINKNHRYLLSDEYTYSIGFFHDCGIPAFSNKFDDYKETLIICNGEKCNSVTLEVNKYNTSHTVLGYLIATYWGLPDDLCKIILHHHDIDFLSKSRDINEQIGFSILKLAEHFVHRNKRYCESPDWQHVKSDVLNFLKLDIKKYIDLEQRYCALIC